MSQTPDTKPENMKFEQAMAQLEELVGRLEKGDMPLDEALDAFEKGVGLVKSCQKQLKSAELRVEKVLTDEDGQPTSTQTVEETT